MSLTLSPEAGARAAKPRRTRLAIPWPAAAALLVAEYLVTSYAVDVRPLAERSDWLGTFGGAGSAGPIVLSIVTATVLIGGRRLLAELQAALDRAAEVREARSPLGLLTTFAVHLAGFAGLCLLPRLLPYFIQNMKWPALCGARRWNWCDAKPTICWCPRQPRSSLKD